jgi:hypothetical protein
MVRLTVFTIYRVASIASIIPINMLTRILVTLLSVAWLTGKVKHVCYTLSMDLRLELIEAATNQPNNIRAWYDRYLLHVGEDSFLSSDAPPEIPLWFRGHLKYYDARIVPFVLAGKSPTAPKTCNLSNCLNPAHAKY